MKYTHALSALLAASILLCTSFTSYADGVTAADAPSIVNGTPPQIIDAPASSDQVETLPAASVPVPDVPDKAPFDVDCKSAVLMDLATGTVLYAKNATESLPPASVTKIMTLLLTMEALDESRFALTDKVQVSDYAASMGGSQVFLKAGEELTVEELIKSTVIASANDSAVALAELISGSVDAFVSRMNQRAAELGMGSTHFENPTGLDDDVTNHVTSAYDIAVMSRELSKHETIFSYSSIWMDSIRDGAFGLTNTNRLVRFYNGATGLKTGSTAAAKFCISATAKRDGMHLCAVIMGAPSRDIRNHIAKTLLDWGFSNYFVYSDPGAECGVVRVIGGTVDSVPVAYGKYEALLPSSKRGNIEVAVNIPESVNAPVKKGDALGTVTYSCGDEVIGEGQVTACADAEKIGFGEILRRIFSTFLLI